MDISEALKWAKSELLENNVEQPDASARFLLRQSLSVDQAYLIAHEKDILSAAQQRKFIHWIERRSKHEPVWYITGKIEFYGQDFFVNENVLIPRPETELMLELILKQISKNTSSTILDIGTGSGAIILTLAKELGFKNRYFASDISENALRVAKKNAKNLGFVSKVTFKKGDLLSPWIGHKFDLVVANLPYVPHEEMASLALDLIDYEPRVALDGGVKGLDIYRRFLNELPDFLTPNGIVFCEIGEDQGNELKKIASQVMPSANINIHDDYSKTNRVLIIRN